MEFSWGDFLLVIFILAGKKPEGTIHFFVINYFISYGKKSLIKFNKSSWWFWFPRENPHIEWTTTFYEKIWNLYSYVLYLSNFFIKPWPTLCFIVGFCSWIRIITSSGQFGRVSGQQVSIYTGRPACDLTHYTFGADPQGKKVRTAILKGRQMSLSPACIAQKGISNIN